jgi:simple sugar transport system permease protein
MSQAPISAPPPAVDERVKPHSLLHKLLARPELGSLVGAIVIYVFFFVVAEPFRSAAALSTILYVSSTYGIMAVGVALLMIGGEFDLSAGVAVTTAALASSLFAFQFSLNVWVGILFGLAMALAIGFVNGYLVIRTGIPSFLITLGTFLMLQGLNLAITKLLTGQVASQSIQDMDGYNLATKIFASEFNIAGVSVRITVVYWLIFVAIATWILLRTKVGNWIYAVGGDAESARAVGVPVAKTKIGLFMGVGFLAWFSGMHLLFRFDTVQSGEGVGNEFIYIIAAVIGGCLLTGGYGTAVGAAIGAFIYGMTNQGIVYAGWNPDWVKFFLGVMLLLATVTNLWVRNQASRR